MGGNVVIDGAKAEKIPAQWRGELICDVENLFCRLNANEDLFPGRVFAADLASGSTAFIYDKKISQDELEMFKPFFGDLDYQIDINKLSILKARLDQMMKRGTKHPKFELYGYKQTTNTVVTLWHYKGINVQIDFEGVEFESDGLPSAWAKFSYSASWADTLSSIKGVAHKYVFRALTARWLDTYVVDGKENYTSVYAFSNKGLRLKYRPKPQGGWEKAPVEYITDLDHIIEILFSGKVPDRFLALIARLSYSGMLGLIERFIPAEEHLTIANGMANLLWGATAQRIYSSDFEDQLCKQRIMLHMSTALNIPHNRWDDMIHSYYG